MNARGMAQQSGDLDVTGMLSELYTWETVQPGMRGEGGRSRPSSAWQFPNERRQRELQEGQALGGALLCVDNALALRPTP